MIQVENLTISYGALVAVSSVNLRVEAGAVFGLIGPNGAGKTSMIRAIAGLLVPAGGRCLVNGVDVQDDPAQVRRMIGYMPDFFGVYDNLTASEYLELFGGLYGLRGPGLSRRIAEVLELGRLTGKADAYVGGLSRGMKQQLCLARSLLHDPAVLLLDEPASGVDPGGRYEMRGLLRSLGALGKTVLISSHILPELADMCDTIGIMETGQIVATGPIAAISSQLQASRVLSMRILDGMAGRVPELLAGMEAVQSVRVDDDSAVQVALTNDDAAVAETFGRLVSGGLRIGGITEVKTDLESLYIKLTHGEVT